MRRASATVVVVVLVFVSGCAAMMVSDLKGKETEYWTPLLNDPDLISINEKFWIGHLASEKERPLRYYEINQYPTNKEQQALKKFYGYELGWQEILKGTVSNYSNAYNDIVCAAFSAGNNLKIELIMGKMTYGEYALAQKKVGDKAKEALHARDNQVMAQQAAMFNRYLLNQQLINTMNQPAQIRPFTCTRAGGGTYFCQ